MLQAVLSPPPVKDPLDLPVAKMYVVPGCGDSLHVEQKIFD